jgi:hypothetical protein
MTKSPRLTRFMDSHNSTTGILHWYCVGDTVSSRVRMNRIGKGSNEEDKYSTRVYNYLTIEDCSRGKGL